MSRVATKNAFDFLFGEPRKAIATLLVAVLGLTALSAPQASANSIATLSVSSIIKGITPTSLGPDYTALSQLGSQANGATTLSSIQAADTSNTGSYVTSFIPTDAGASTTKVVFYASGTTVTAPITTFATDTAYNGSAALTGGGFFVIEVTAADGTKNYYQIAVAVLPATADATLKSTSTIKGQMVSSLGSPNTDITLVDSDPMLPRGAVTLSSSQAVDTSTATSFVATDSLAVVTKVVKFAQGTNVSSTSFAAATAYAGQSITDQDFFIVQVTASDTTTVLFYKFAVTVTAPVVASSDATLTTMSTIKGQSVSNLGTPNATLASAVAGGVTLSAAQGADTSNAGSYASAFMPNDPGATVTRTVKYASGASTTGFATDSVYSGTAAITNGDFFVVQVTAANASIFYYRIAVTVAAATATVPSLSGLSKTAAESAVTGAGFTVGTETSVGNAEGATSGNNGNASGTQTPSAGSSATIGSVVSFSYYTDTTPSATVPNLYGLSTSAAEIAIRNAGLTVGTETPVNNAGGATASNFGNATGTQSPASGSSASVGSSVSFSFYSYTAPPVPAYVLSYVVPSDQGSLIGAANQTVSAGGTGMTVTAVGNSGWVFKSWSDGLRTSSRRDTLTNHSDAFFAYFLRVVPNLTGLTKAAAEKALAEADFTLGTETLVGNAGGATAANDGKATGTQSPLANSAGEQGATVNFSYYKYTAYTLPAPTITGLGTGSYSVGSTAGGTIIIISGTGFVSGARLLVGGADAIILSTSDTTIAAKTPPGKAGTVDVTVVNPDGQFATGTKLFTYQSRTFIVSSTDISVAVGSKTTIWIGSTNGLEIGSKVQVQSSSTQVTVSPEATVSSATFSAPVVITGVSLGAAVITVSQAGYEDVLINVTVTPVVPNLSGLNKFDAEAAIVAAGYTVGTETVVQNHPAITMAGSQQAASDPGRNAGQTPKSGSALAAGSSVAFSYYALRDPAPLVSSFDVKVGLLAGGTQIHVIGHGLDIRDVYFGNTRSSYIHGVDSNNYYIASAPGIAGAVDVTIVNQDGQRWTGKAYFTYVVPTVPDLSGLTKKSAEKAITDAGLKVGIETSLDNSGGATAKNDGQTSRTQSPIAGSAPDAGSTVDFSYYTYTAPAAPTVQSVDHVPDSKEFTINGTGFADGAVVKIGTMTVTNISSSRSTFLVASLGLTDLGYIPSSPQDVKVINPDQQVGIGKGIFTWGTGARVIPDLKGLTIAAAKDAITKAGFTVGRLTAVVKYAPDKNTPADNQLVTGTQSPTAGSVPRTGPEYSQVDFSYYSYQVNINFTGGGGSAPLEGGEYSQEADVPTALTPNKFVYPGHIFAGWLADKAYSDGAVISFEPKYTGAVFIAQWSPITYQVSFDANGAKGDTPTAISSNLDKGVALPGVGTMTKSGFVFGGWSTTGTAPAASSTSYTTGADVTLLAIWNVAPAASTIAKTTTKVSKKKPTKKTQAKTVVAKVSVPDLTGLTKAAAEASITISGFKVGTETSVGNSGGATKDNDGKVTSVQSPVATSMAGDGSAIDFSYYSYKAPAPVVISVQYVALTSTLHIHGSGFVNDATVTIGGYILSGAEVQDSSLIDIPVDSAVLAQIPSGSQVTTVTNPDGQSATGVGMFTRGTKNSNYVLPSNLFVYGSRVPSPL